jgi:hypothetical protein
MPPLVEFEVFRDYLKVDATDPAVDDVSRLLDAICAEVRLLARRSFEGDEGGSYSQVIQIRGAREFDLPHVPVRAIASIERVRFDGTVDDAYATTDWRLEDADRGHVSLLPGTSSWSATSPFFYRDHHWGGPEYVQVTWTTTGDIPPQIPQAVLEWGKSRWDTRDQVPGLTGYSTGGDSETYSEALAGKPPHDVMRAILGVRHATGGGVV